jgi:predicted RND superfamily exporter protein
VARTLSPRSITELALRHRAAVLVVTALLLVVSALGIARLRFDFSSQAFYAADPEQAQALADLHARWGPDDARLFVVARADAPDGVITAARLDALAELARAIEAVPGVARAWGVADLPTPDGRTVRERVDGPGTAAIVRTLLAATPAVPLLLSKGGDVTAIVVDLEDSSDDPSAVQAEVEAVHAIAHRAEGSAELSLAVAGVPVVRAAFLELAIADQARLQPLVYAAMAGLLALGFRRLHGVLVPLAAASLPVVLLTGAMGWAGEPIGLLNQAYFTLLPVIAAAESVHWIARYHERLRETGRNDPEARREALSHTAATMGRACAFTTGTTAAGFLSLMVASMPILRAFGMWAALGIAVSFVVTIAVVPVLLSLSSASPVLGRPVGRVAARLGAFAVERPLVVVLVSIAIGAAAVLGASRIVVDNRLGDLLDASHPARQASEQVDRDLGGTLSLEVELAGPPGTWDVPEARAALAAFESRIASDPEVRAVLGPSAAAFAGPDLSAQVLDRAHGVARIRAFVADSGGVAFEAFARRVEAMRPELQGVKVSASGTTRMAYTGVNRITEDLRASLAGLLAVVTLVFALLARSARIALVTVPVNALPLVVGVALVGSRGTPLDPIAAVVLAIGLGLAVDDTIHLLLRAREHGGAPRDAIEHAVATTGRAAALSSLALAAGVGVNLLSSFPPLRTLAVLGGATIVAALVADLLLLPALVALTSPRR